MKRSTLLDLNSFSLNESGVYVPGHGVVPERGYSDGDANEDAVMQVLKKSRDVSAYSLELEGSWKNWAEEAHLSSRRVNLLAALGWRRGAKVLEVGCGCGVLTRYLGEQDLLVDALEISARRAAIARERCRDLGNVDVYCANLNELSLPREEYDYILLVGVMEYTARFAATEGPVEDLIRQQLRRCLSAATGKGVVFIAIENRLGFKYIAGACEDHYGIPRVGIYNYPTYDSAWSRKKSGIHTLDYRQWNRLLDSLDGAAYEFFFPFPDYKVPEAVVHERYLNEDQYCYQVLNRVFSRDYCSRWSSPIDEYLYWQSSSQCGRLGEAANSFGIAVGKDRTGVEAFMPYDFVRFPNLKRKPEYRRHTCKRRGESRVRKEAVRKWQGAGSHDSPVRHETRDSGYVRGKLLSDVWVEALTSFGEKEILEALIREYHAYLSQHRDLNGPGGGIDLLVFNVIVDEDGAWHVIDKEWKWKRKGDLTAEFILYRTLLYFGYVHGDAVANCLEAGPASVGGFVRFGFQCAGLDYDRGTSSFSRIEDEFQAAVLNERAYQSTRTIERQPLLFRYRQALPTTSICVFWKAEGRAFSAADSVEREFRVYPDELRFRIDLPDSTNRISAVRIDPVDHGIPPGYRMFQIQRIRITGDDGIMELQAHAEIVECAGVSGMYAMDENRNEWLVTSNDPQIVIGGTERGRRKLSEIGCVRSVEVQLQWPDRCFRTPLEQRLLRENVRLQELLNGMGASV